MATRWQSTSAWAERLRSNDTIMKIAANTSWLLGDRLVRASLGFIVGAWVARYLGPEQFGHYAYVLTLIAFFQAVANLGADSIVVRDIARDPTSARVVLGSAIRLRVISGVVCWLSAILVAVAIDPFAYETILMTAIIGGVMVFQAADTVDLWFQSQSQSRRTVIAKLTAYTLASGLKVALILAGAPLWAFALAMLFDFVVSAIALTIAYLRFPTSERWQYDASVASRLLIQSWPFLVSAISITIYLRIDLLMLKALRGNEEVGIYAAALPVSQLWQMIPMALVVSFGPYIAQRKRDGEIGYNLAMQFVFRLFASLTLAGAFATVIAAPWLLPAVYGQQFLPSVPVLQIHVFSNVFVAISVAQTLWIVNEQRNRLLLWQTAAGAFFVVVGNWFAIPIWGALGSAGVAVAAQFGSIVVVNVLFAPRLLRLQLGLRMPGNHSVPG